MAPHGDPPRSPRRSRYPPRLVLPRHSPVLSCPPPRRPAQHGSPVWVHPKVRPPDATSASWPGCGRLCSLAPRRGRSAPMSARLGRWRENPGLRPPRHPIFGIDTLLERKDPLPSESAPASPCPWSSNRPPSGTTSSTRLGYRVYRDNPTPPGRCRCHKASTVPCGSPHLYERAPQGVEAARRCECSKLPGNADPQPGDKDVMGVACPQPASPSSKAPVARGELEELRPRSLPWRHHWAQGPLPVTAYDRPRRPPGPNRQGPPLWPQASPPATYQPRP
mmetsp:Transcript_65840/g.140862  ORF Transcript_65840/g.140862 Transcript_65840/m.140862 type:complete len:278 (+) Transcript_65840:1093-1926(+)